MMAKRLRITGLVQGVGYRAAFLREAERLGLSGWVRNRLDGSVEALVAGDTAALDAITQWARRGPALAQVDAVKTEDAGDADAAQAGSGGMQMRPTA
jgi:acylphosphatase